MKKQFEFVDSRLVIYKGFVCPYEKECKRSCVAKYPVQITEFDCGLFQEFIISKEMVDINCINVAL